MAKNDKATKLVKATGELIEYDISTPEKMMEAYAICNEYKKAYDYVLGKIKEKVPEIVDARGMYEYNGRAFRVMSIQRYNYDKRVLDRVIKDEDLREMMLEPNKKFIDEWLKENVDKTGEVGTELRNTMVPVGNPYQVVKQEKI